MTDVSLSARARAQWARLRDSRAFQIYETAEQVSGVLSRLVWLSGFVGLAVATLVLVLSKWPTADLWWKIAFGSVVILTALVFMAVVVVIQHGRVQRIQPSFERAPARPNESKARPVPEPPDRSNREQLADGRELVLHPPRLQMSSGLPSSGPHIGGVMPAPSGRLSAMHDRADRRLLPRVEWTTEDGRDYLVRTRERANAIRFVAPHEQTVREADLPVDVPDGGTGRIVVKKFTTDGFTVDEIDSSGVKVVAEVYFDESDAIGQSNLPDVLSAEGHVQTDPAYVSGQSSVMAKYAQLRVRSSVPVENCRARLISATSLDENGIDKTEIELPRGYLQWSAFDGGGVGSSFAEESTVDVLAFEGTVLGVLVYADPDLRTWRLDASEFDHVLGIQLSADGVAPKTVQVRLRRVEGSFTQLALPDMSFAVEA